MSLGPTIFNLYKPPGPSSNDILRRFMRSLPKGIGGKMGHFGTLDPFACGVLLVGAGGAMRLMKQVHEQLPKTYLCVGKVGVSTTTGDLTGEVLDPGPQDLDKARNLTAQELDLFFKERFIGDYWQTPPSFSATKHEGVPLYRLARRGIAIEKPKVLRKVFSIEVLRYRFPYVLWRAEVSTGTYMRTLFQDAMAELNLAGTLSGLMREKIGSVSVRDSLLPHQWEGVTQKSGPWLVEPAKLLPLPQGWLQGRALDRYRNGISVHRNEFNFKSPEETSLASLWVKDDNERLVGIGHLVNDFIRPTMTWGKSSSGP